MEYQKQTDNWFKELSDGTTLVMGEIQGEYCLWIDNSDKRLKLDGFYWFKSLDEGLKFANRVK